MTDNGGASSDDNSSTGGRSMKQQRHRTLLIRRNNSNDGMFGLIGNHTTAITSSSSSNGVSRFRQQPSNANKKQRSPAFYVVIFLSGLMVAYVAIVFTVTVANWPKVIKETNKSTKMNNPEKNNNKDDQNKNHMIRTGDIQIKGVDINGKLEKDEEDKKTQRKIKAEEVIVGDDSTTASGSANKSKRKSVYKKHDLTLNLTHGVQPHVLIPHDSAIHDELPVAYKDDVPKETHPTPDYVLKAFIEQVDVKEWTVKPLPIRSTAKAESLQSIEYPRVRSCSKLLQQFPIDDTPTDADTFLPWIHDVFPTADGMYIQIIAQNKRRCKNGSKEKDILAKMNPQASLFQHLSVQRVQQGINTTRYKLVPHEQADADAVATRFICRFKPSMEETLSEYNFDYDWTAYRKRYKVSFAEDDAGIKAIHSSQLIFKCPVPPSLQETIRNGASVQNDWASLFLDLIPIRTPPRWGPPAQYMQPRYKEFQSTDPAEVFDPITSWGSDHIIPVIEDSGRWENLPICMPSLMQYENQNVPAIVTDVVKPQKKKHKLVSCIWASAGYTTRGNRFAINDGQRRLLEWITYNKIIGFDHFYVYDNSGAFGSDTSLKPIADLFGPNDVTYIPWPAQICNNNPNNVDSVGERSSQYAAEQSCRLRFGPHVEWIGQFDIDEYLVPMGNHKNVLQLLDELDNEGTKIISFASWRAWPRWDYISEPVKISDPEVCWHNEPCFELSIPQKYTMLQAYNCDRQKPGHKTSAMPAEKQVYKADYVVSHFVHYSVVTVLSEKNKTEYEKEGFAWKKRAFPDPRQRFADEVKEGLMIHTKAVARQDTAGWERMCHINNTFLPERLQGLCRLGVPWPDEETYDFKPGVLNATANGRAYNCFVNKQVEDYLVPQLNEGLAKHSTFFAIE